MISVTTGTTVPELVIDGTSYMGWKQFTLSRSMDAVEHSLQAETIDQWVDTGDAVPIERNDSVEVRYGNEVLMTGYVDEVAPQYDAQSHHVAIVCVSDTADLVDSSALNKGPWKDSATSKIASDLVSDFAAGVLIDGPEGDKFARFRVEQDELVIDTIRRLASARGLVVLTGNDGRLLLTRAATEAVSFTIQAARSGGRTVTNVLTGEFQGSSRDRFSEYFVTSQNSNKTNFSGKVASGALYKTSDTQITRYRPLLVRANTQETTLEGRGNWELNTRAGKSERYIYTLEGWEYAPGKVWAPNLLVPVDDELLDVQDNLLVASATLSVGEQSLITTLELAPPSAFDALPVFDIKRERKRKRRRRR